MRTKRESGYTKVWISARETREWAHKDGASWPCSFLSGRRLFAEFDRNGDLVDLAIDGGRGNQDCPNDEFYAIVSDMLGTSLPMNCQTIDGKSFQKVLPSGEICCILYV